MTHTHDDDDRLTFGCKECLARVQGDQFWAKVHEESSAIEDEEFGLPVPSMMLYLIDVEGEGKADKHMRFIPNWMLRSLLQECGQADVTLADFVMREAARRIPNDQRTAL